MHSARATRDDDEDDEDQVEMTDDMTSHDGPTDAAGPVVVGVLSHRDPPLVRRLVERLLEGERTVVLVHHDPRGPALDLPRSDRVLFVPDPQPCRWGRIGFAQAMLRMVDVAGRSVPDLSWLLLISGQDYPCRSMVQIEAELASSPHDAYLRWLPVADPREDVHPWQQRTRRRYLHRLRVPFSHRHVPAPRRSPFRDGVGLYVGDTWPNLGAAAVAHLRGQQALRARVEPYLRWCQCPDEALLPTLLMNGAERLSIVNDRKRYVCWTEGDVHPRLLQAADAPDILGSADFFARKVDQEHSGQLLSLLDAGRDGTG